MKIKNKRLGEALLAVDSTLSFTLMEIGAASYGGKQEPFYALLDIFPESKIIAFEVDKTRCEELNKKTTLNITYYPVALGRTEEQRAFYETNHPMCCSLYRPNEKLLRLYNNMEAATLKSVTNIDTYSIDYFIKENGIGSIDFIKIDVQGAELDIFQGAVNALKSVVAIVSEVEFIPHYIDQPLFGDVCQFLTKNGMMFHKFTGLAGRALKPVVIGNDINYPSQHIWTDALFISDILKLDELPPKQLLKLGVLAHIYDSIDLAFLCFRSYDEKNGTQINASFIDLFMR